MLLKSSEPSVGVENTWSGLKSALITASENTCGRTKGHPKKRVTWWWNKEVGAAVAAKRQSWRLKNQGLVDKHIYIAAKKTSDRLVYEAKRAAETLEFGGLSNSKDCRENAFKLAKQMMAENQDVVGDPCIMNDAGCMAFTDSDKLKAWKEHYQRLLNEEFE